MGSTNSLRLMAAASLRFIFLSLPPGFLCLRIVTPGKWGGRPANCSSPLKAVQTGYVIVLHTAGGSCKTGAECNQQMTNIQHYHMNNKGWCNIAYNFLIGEDGKVYEGRGWNTEGAHTYGYNDISLGIAFMGDFTGNSCAAISQKGQDIAGVRAAFLKAPRISACLVPSISLAPVLHSRPPPHDPCIALCITCGGWGGEWDGGAGW
uniref:Peptidoglycan-recognition protein n=1 Tax=Terrapene triunguis TaxID=2587831 RepID=A0A674JM88_9SAUR